MYELKLHYFPRKNVQNCEQNLKNTYNYRRIQGLSDQNINVPDLWLQSRPNNDKNDVVCP